MAETYALEEAVRRVLPALNLTPSQFRLDPGFVRRAERSGKPRFYVLNSVEKRLVC